jgi:apolipoprotein N-acyltransferase
MKKGIIALSLALILLCAITLFFVLLSWWLGGDDYKDTILGNYTIPALFLGIAFGVAIRFFGRHQSAPGPVLH